MVRLDGAYLGEVDLLTSQMKLPCIFFFYFILFIYFWLCWVFVAMWAVCLIVATMGSSLAAVHGLLTVVAS